MREQIQPGKSGGAGLSLVAALLGGVLALTGCSSPSGPKVRLEAYTWWKRNSEQNAFEKLLRVYNDSHEDAAAFNQQSGTDADTLRGTLSARLLAGAPPSTFQANLGADLLRWTVVDTADGSPSEGRIANLSQLFQRHGLESVLPEHVLDAVRGPDGAPYAVPLNIHRLNLIYYNTAALAARPAGHSFLDPDVLCPPDLETNRPVAPLDVKIAVGTKDNFTLVLFALESVLPAVAGADAYERLFHGQADGDWALVRRALLCVQYLSRSFIRDPELDWAEALHRVQDQTADFSVMGDWSNSELKMDLESGLVGVAPFPGSEGTFVFTSDTFPAPIEAPYPEKSKALLESFVSREAQAEFNALKGSIPARTDAEVSGELAMRTRDDFTASTVKKVLATSGLFPPYFPTDLNAKLIAMTNPGASDPEIAEVMALLRDAQPLFVRWQRRLGKQLEDL